MSIPSIVHHPGQELWPQQTDRQTTNKNQKWSPLPKKRDLLAPFQNCIGPTLRIGREIQCLPNAGFLIVPFPKFWPFESFHHSLCCQNIHINKKKSVMYTVSTIYRDVPFTSLHLLFINMQLPQFHLYSDMETKCLWQLGGKTGPGVGRLASRGGTESIFLI